MLVSWVQRRSCLNSCRWGYWSCRGLICINVLHARVCIYRKRNMRIDCYRSFYSLTTTYWNNDCKFIHFPDSIYVRINQIINKFWKVYEKFTFTNSSYYGWSILLYLWLRRYYIPRLCRTYIFITINSLCNYHGKTDCLCDVKIIKLLNYLIRAFYSVFLLDMWVF